MPGFDTVTVNVNVPPGTTRLRRTGVLDERDRGLRGDRTTTASSLSVTVEPWFVPLTVTTLVWVTAADPPLVTGADDVIDVLSPTARTSPARSSQCYPRPAASSRLPKRSSTRLVIVTGETVLGLETVTR